MADVSKIFKPRRGLASTMSGAGKKDIVLAKGEMFVEAPSTGMGTGESKIKIGDGTTAYASLPYALGDTSNNKIEFTSNTSTTVATALNSVASGNALKTIIAGLKQAISLCNTSITQLNDDTSKINTYVGDDGLIHFTNKDGADTVLNFSKGNEILFIEYGFEQHGIKWWEETYSYDINLSTYYANYNNITVENIKSISLLTAECVNSGSHGPWAMQRLTYNYNSITGVLTIITNYVNFCMPIFLIIIYT